MTTKIALTIMTMMKIIMAMADMEKIFMRRRRTLYYNNLRYLDIWFHMNRWEWRRRKGRSMIKNSDRELFHV